MKVIITGTTGMVGEGVLLECLEDSQITQVLSVSRKSIMSKAVIGFKLCSTPAFALTEDCISRRKILEV